MNNIRVETEVQTLAEKIFKLLKACNIHTSDTELAGDICDSYFDNPEYESIYSEAFDIAKDRAIDELEFD